MLAQPRTSLSDWTALAVYCLILNWICFLSDIHIGIFYRYLCTRRGDIYSILVLTVFCELCLHIFLLLNCQINSIRFQICCAVTYEGTFHIFYTSGNLIIFLSVNQNTKSRFGDTSLNKLLAQSYKLYVTSTTVTYHRFSILKICDELLNHWCSGFI